MVANPESTLVARLYRTVLPAHLRYRIAQRVPIGVRSRAKSVIARGASVHVLRPLTSSASEVVRRGGAPSGDGRRALDGAIRVTRVREGLASVLDARRASYDEVVTALDAAGVPHFAVRGEDPRRSVVAVDEKDAEKAFSELAGLVRRTAGYSSTLRRGQEPGDSRIVPGLKDVDVTSHTLVGAAVFWYWTDASGTLILGAEQACDVEIWRRGPHGQLVAPRRNLVSETVRVDEPEVLVSERCLTALAGWEAEGLPEVRTRETFAHRRPQDVTFEVDVVFTWVDGADPAWRRRRAAVEQVAYHEDADSAPRYLNSDELKFALRSIELYAPWVRTVHLVTDQQVPEWLDTGATGLNVVDHREIFPDQTALPTFNSHAIESQLHRIEGLSEHFVYFNDDMMLGRPVTPDRFFEANGISHFFPSPATVAHGLPETSDVPVTIAAKNNRSLLLPRFGSSLTNKMKHAPYALRRSVLEEISAEFTEAYERTMRSQLRSETDISVVSSFYHWYAFETGRAVPGVISYRYVDLGLPDARRQLGIVLAERRHEAICLNTTVSTSDDLPSGVVQEFLETYFPAPSRFERR